MTSDRRDGAAEPGPVVWMFPGQGAQYFRMGQALYERNGPFRHWMDRLDGVAADYVGQSIVHILYDADRSGSQPFDHILHTHPALFMVQYAMARELLADGFPAPDYLLGASLGEFVAAAVAGAADVETMLFDVIKQARLFEAQCGGGAMLAVINDPDTFHTDPVFSGRCELAAVNFDQCFVVAGWRAHILEVAAHLARHDVAHQLLPVPVAFHSSLVDPVEDTFIRSFSGRVGHAPHIPVISCAAASDRSGGAGDRTGIAAEWWRIIRQPIAFRQTLGGFARAHPRAVYLDVGPAGNMATFARYNLPKPGHDRIMSILTPFNHAGESIGLARDRLAALR